VTSPEELYSFRALWRQYRACRRNKRNTRNQLAFEIDLEANLFRLQEELRAHTYRPGRSICFVTGGPKPREVFAADFRDRVVHHLLVAQQEPVFERHFIHDSFACRQGKGTLAGSDRLMTFLRQATANGRRPAWALRLDVASFFPSIDKATLYDLLVARVRDPEIGWLTRTVLFHDPTEDYAFRARDRCTPPPGTPGYPIPARKSLFGKHNARGLPIGNLTSQFWANVYLNKLDQFVKRRLGVRWYVRYVDDLVLLAPSPEPLVGWREAIREELGVHLQLALRREGQEPFPVARGIEFVGWRTWWNHRVPRRRTLGNLTTRLDRFARRHCHRGPLRGTTAIALAGARAEHALGSLRASVASYSGHLRHGSAWRAWVGIWAHHAWLGVLFARDGWAFVPRWPTRSLRAASRFHAQYWGLVQHAGERVLVFCPVGRFIEFYGPQRLVAERVLGLRPVYLPRAGYGFAVGFPRRLSYEYARRAMQAGLAVLLVGAGAGALREGPRRRWATRLLVAQQAPE